MADYNLVVGADAPFVEVMPKPILATRAPAATDINFPIGQSWVRTDTAQVYMLAQKSAGSASWPLASPGASDVDTLTGDAGGAISPAVGNITLAGGTNIGTSGAGSTITFNLDAAITLATSVTSPIYTAAAGLAIRSAGGADITMRMGDAAGANVIAFTDSANAQVASLDSNGTLTVVNMDGIIGATTAAAGTFTTLVANTSVTSPIYTSTGAVDTAIRSVAGQDIIIRMGDAAAANKVSFTDSADAEVASIDSNGAFTTTGLTFTGLLTANASATINTAGTALNLGTDNSGDAVNLGTGNVIRAIGIANAGGVAHTVAVGSASAGAITVDTSAGISLDAATASNFTVTGAADITVESTLGAANLLSGEGNADSILIHASNAAGGMQLRAGSAGILIGTDADTATLSLGDIAPTATRTTTIAGGTVVTAAVTDTLDLAPDGATTNADSVKTVNVNAGGVTTGQVLTNVATGTVTSGTHTTAIASGNRVAGTMALNMMTGTGTKTANLGNADGLTTLNIDAITLINDSINVNTSINTGTSTGAVAIGNALSGAVTIDSVSTVELNSAGAAISIGNDADAFGINVGTGGAARTITIGNDTGATSVVVNCGTGALDIGQNGIARAIRIGNDTGASSLTLAAGTGDITVTGTVKEIDAEFLSTSGDDVIFQENPIVLLSGNAPALPTGATGTVNLIGLRNMQMEQFTIGAGQTIIAPVMDATGLLVSGDLTATEGYEYNWGAALATSRHAFTIGTSAAFFLQWEFTVADVSGADPYHIGFRRSAANNADYTTYTDFVSIGLNFDTNDATVVLQTRLNSGAITSTNTTDAWTDGQSHVLRINVSGAGVVTYTIDGLAPSVTAAFTFDNGDVVCPYFLALHRAGAGNIHWENMKCGFQA